MNQPEGPGLPAPQAGDRAQSTATSAYDIAAATTRAGKQRIHPSASEEPLEVGQIVRLEGRYWLIELSGADDEASPDGGHGWMCRLADSGALTEAGFQRVRKATLDLLEP